MTHSDSSSAKHFIRYSNLFSLCSNAFSLIKRGEEKQAKEKFPMEYHFIKKYVPVDLEELATILSHKLELH